MDRAASVVLIGMMLVSPSAVYAGDIKDAAAIDAAIDANRLSEAMRLGAAARLAHPDSAAVAISYGFALTLAHRFDEAQVAADAAIALAPENGLAHYLLGVVLIWGADWDRTATALRRALGFGLAPADESAARAELERIVRWQRIAGWPEPTSEPGRAVKQFVDAVGAGRVAVALNDYVDIEGVAEDLSREGISLSASQRAITSDEEAAVVGRVSGYLRAHDLAFTGVEIGEPVVTPAGADGLETAHLKLTTLTRGRVIASDIEALRDGYAVILQRRARGESDQTAVSLITGGIDAHWINVFDGLEPADRETTLSAVLGRQEDYEETYDVSLVRRDGQWLIADIDGTTLASVFGRSLREQLYLDLRLRKTLRDDSDSSGGEGKRSTKRLTGIFALLGLLGAGVVLVVRRLRG